MSKKPLDETTDDTLVDRLADASAEDLRAEIEALRAENATLKNESQRAADAARNSALMLSQFTEVWAGKTDPDKNGNVEDLWEYTIDLALNGGKGLRINGTWYYHGQTYTFTTSQLQTVKDMVYRTHVHESMVFGNTKENFYRQQNKRSITNGRMVNMA